MANVPLLFLNLLGTGFGLVLGPDGVIVALPVAADFDGEELDASHKDGIILRVILLGINANEGCKAVVLDLVLKFLAKGSPFLLCLLVFKILLHQLLNVEVGKLFSKGVVNKVVLWGEF